MGDARRPALSSPAAAPASAWRSARQLLAEGGRSSRSTRAGRLRASEADGIEVDLADRAATRAAAAEVAALLALTTLVHNAGVIRPALLADVKLDDLDALVELHLGARSSWCRRRCRRCARAASAGSCCSRRAPRSACDAERLLGDQGGDARHGAHLGARARRRRHHGQRRGAGAGPHRHVPRGRPRRQRAGPSPGRLDSRRPHRRSRRRRPGGRRSSPIRRTATSPGRRCSSAAAAASRA